MALAISITVNGVERNNVIRFDSVKREDNLNSLVDTLSFSIDYPNVATWRPTVNGEVVMSIDGTRVFGGIIIEIEERYLGNHALVYDVKCKDYAHLFDRNLVTDRYEDETVQDALVDIVEKYTTGFTTTNIGGASLTPDAMTFDGMTVSECFTQVARRYNYKWFVDYYKNVHFFEKDEVLAPFDLTDTSNNYIYDSLNFRTDFTQLRNRVRIKGGESESNPRTETHSGTGSKEEFALAYKYAGLPTVLVDSVAQVVGVDGLDDDGDKDVLWSYQEKYLRFTAGHIPAAGTDNIEVTGVPLLPLNVIVSDGPSIATYGVYEFRKEEKRLTTKPDALAFAQAELDAYKSPIIEGDFETNTPGLRSGQTINVNSTLRGLNEDFIIQSVSITLQSRDKALYSVKLASSKVVSLTELLQELLRDDSVSLDELESIFTFEQLFDIFGMTDSVTVTPGSVAPYYYADAAVNGNEAVWNKSTWT